MPTIYELFSSYTSNSNNHEGPATPSPTQAMPSHSSNNLSISHTTAFLSAFYGSATKAPRSVLPAELLLAQILSYERPLTAETVPLMKLRGWLAAQAGTSTGKSRNDATVIALGLLNQVLVLHLENGGEKAAADILRRLALMARDDLSCLPEPGVGISSKSSKSNVVWRSKTLVQLLGLLAVPRERMHETLDAMVEYDGMEVEALKKMLGGSGNGNGNLSLTHAFERAKMKTTMAVAMAKLKEKENTQPQTRSHPPSKSNNPLTATTTLLLTSLIDVAALELRRNSNKTKSKDGEYTSFAHDFVLGVGPEGVRIWQCAEERGVGLMEYVCEKDETRVRSWEEAEEWVAAFEKMVARKVCALLDCLSRTPFDPHRSLMLGCGFAMSNRWALHSVGQL